MDSLRNEVKAFLALRGPRRNLSFRRRDTVSNVMTMITRVSLNESLWIFYLFFVIHELEEWNIARFEKRVFAGLPATHNDRNARAWIGVVCMIGFAWCAAATLPSSPRVAAYIILPAIAFSAANALQHVYWSLRFRSVAPGLVSAVVLMLPSTAYLTFLIISYGLVSPWYAAGLSVLALMMLAGTVKSGDSAPSIIPAIYGIGDRASKLAHSIKMLTR